MHDFHISVGCRWEFPHLVRTKSEYGRVQRRGARMNRNDAFLNSRRLGKPIKRGR